MKEAAAEEASRTANGAADLLDTADGDNADVGLAMAATPPALGGSSPKSSPP
eukprot:CAMPEP_0183736136 /NCGR_PEP_ID=MMETSP0737-20130205/48581_1 /TAXON_ID=385413 /ORGANISM="Thalassiosira miniscula, Strain CCMP1093" /LENGTH=51 /DNA_ID=CAMNT_0025970069 /DNA_START=26 /DNA_END=178 /DNA_ORIENTATION=-